MLLLRRVEWGEPEKPGQPYPTKLVGVVVPDCCEMAAKSLAVILQYRYEDFSDTPAACSRAPEGLLWDTWDYENDREIVSTMQAWLDELPEDERSVTRFEVAVPRWVVGCSMDFAGRQRFYPMGHSPQKTEEFPPTHCPHCGTGLPDIERYPSEELPGPIHLPVADGDHCGTCGERSCNCGCLMPETAWRTVREDSDHRVRWLEPEILIDGAWPESVGKLLRYEHLGFGRYEARMIYGRDYYMQPHAFPPDVYVMSGTEMTEGPHAFVATSFEHLGDRSNEEVLVVSPWEDCSLAPRILIPRTYARSLPDHQPQWLILTEHHAGLIAEARAAGVPVWVDDGDPNTPKQTPAVDPEEA